MGTAYKVSHNRCIKITRDPIEALTMQKLIGTHLKNIVNYYDVIQIKNKFKERKIFVIEMRLGDILSESDAKKASRYMEILGYINFDNSYYLDTLSKEDKYRYLKISEDIKRAYNGLKEQGLYTYDVKHDNMVEINDNIMLIDFRDYKIKGKIKNKIKINDL